MLINFWVESALVIQRFAGCADVKICKQVIVHIFKNTECIASEPKASAAIMFRILKNMNDNLLTDFHVRTTGKTLTDKRRLQPKID